jgi:hypothetical protein
VAAAQCPHVESYFVGNAVLASKANEIRDTCDASDSIINVHEAHYTDDVCNIKPKLKMVL